MSRTVSAIGTLGSGATIVNRETSLGVPVQSGTASVVSVTTSNASIATVAGQANNFNVSMSSGNDTLIAQNMVWANNGAPTVGFTSINMGGGNDSVALDRSGFRTIEMGGGNDTLRMTDSGGQAVSMGGGDDRTFIMNSGDHVTPEEAAQKNGVTMALDGGNGRDTLNLMGDWTVTLTTAVTLLNGTTTTLLTNQNINNVSLFPSVLNGSVRSIVTMSDGTTMLTTTSFQNYEELNAICFTAGTMIETPDGTVAIETLKAGDLVRTKTGFKPVKWIGSRRLDVVDLAANPKLLPVLVPAGAFGNGLPLRDVRFSPQHRVLVRSNIAERMFGSTDVLVAVKQLVGHSGIEIDGEARDVKYIHLMFAEHEVVFVEGIEAESLYPGPQALSFLSDDALNELRAIFPDFDNIAAEGANYATSLPFVKGREARTMAARHTKSGQPFYR